MDHLFAQTFAQGPTGWRPLVWRRLARPLFLGVALAVLLAAVFALLPARPAEAQTACPSYTVPAGDRTNRTPNSAAGVITIPVQDVSNDCPGNDKNGFYAFIDIGTANETYAIGVRSKVTQNRDGSGGAYFAYGSFLYQGTLTVGNRPGRPCSMGQYTGQRAISTNTPHNCVIKGGNYTIYVDGDGGPAGSPGGVDYSYLHMTIYLRRVTIPEVSSSISPTNPSRGQLDEDVILHLGEARVFNISDFFTGALIFPDSATNISTLPLAVTAPGTTIAADSTAQTITLLGSSISSGTATITYYLGTKGYFPALGLPDHYPAPPYRGQTWVINISSVNYRDVTFPLQVRARAQPGQEPKLTDKYFTLDPIAGWDASAVQDDTSAWFVELSWDSVDAATGYIIEARDNGRHLRVSRLTETAFVQASRSVSLPRTPGAEVGTSGQPLTYVVVRVRAYQTQINAEEWYSPWTEDRAVTFFDGDFPRPAGVPRAFDDPLNLLSLTDAVGRPYGFGGSGVGMLQLGWAVLAIVAGLATAWYASRGGWGAAGLFAGALMFTIIWAILGPIYGGVSIPWAVGPLIPITILGLFAMRKQSGA